MAVTLDRINDMLRNADNEMRAKDAALAETLSTSKDQETREDALLNRWTGEGEARAYRKAMQIMDDEYGHLPGDTPFTGTAFFLDLMMSALTMDGLDTHVAGMKRGFIRIAQMIAEAVNFDVMDEATAAR